MRTERKMSMLLRIGCLILVAVLIILWYSVSGLATAGGGDVFVIGVQEAGYGIEWIYTLAEKYTEETGVKVEILHDPTFNTKAETWLATDSSEADLIFTYDFVWQEYAMQGKIADLNDVYSYTYETDEESITFEEKLKDGIRAYGSLEYNGSKNYYTVAWNDGASGIFYNYNLFEEYGWEIPETLDDLIALCDRIKTDTNGEIAPFSYTGQYASSYLNPLIYAWWAQYDGVDMYYRFFDYESTDVFLFEGRQKALEALDSLNLKGLKQSGNATDASSSASHTEMQMQFVNGEAAMTICGAWLYNEMENSMPVGFDMRLMPTPYIDSEHKTRINYAYNGDMMYIPATSKHIDTARDFIKFIHRDENMLEYTRMTGTVMPFEYDFSSIYDDSNDYLKSILDVIEQSTTIYFFSNAPIAYRGGAYVWPLTGMNTYTDVIAGSKTAREQIIDNYNYAETQWQKWLEASI